MLAPAKWKLPLSLLTRISTPLHHAIVALVGEANPDIKDVLVVAWLKLPTGRLRGCSGGSSSCRACGCCGGCARSRASRTVICSRRQRIVAILHKLSGALIGKDARHLVHSCAIILEEVDRALILPGSTKTTLPITSCITLKRIFRIYVQDVLLGIVSIGHVQHIEFAVRGRWQNANDQLAHARLSSKNAILNDIVREGVVGLVEGICDGVNWAEHLRQCRWTCILVHGIHACSTTHLRHAVDDKDLCTITVPVTPCLVEVGTEGKAVKLPQEGLHLHVTITYDKPTQIGRTSYCVQLEAAIQLPINGIDSKCVDCVHRWRCYICWNRDALDDIARRQINLVEMAVRSFTERARHVHRLRE
mmetsp:Transcript_38766/g.89490  ORF Transcript_38766/g.89490 Transcript_38766/m.89490 type:complete len:361 (+) Transcript_38766:149-1231(+)